MPPASPCPMTAWCCPWKLRPRNTHYHILTPAPERA
jgi:hypothetical protein